MARRALRAALALLLLVAVPACGDDAVSADAVAERLTAAFASEDGGGLGDDEAACAGAALVELIGIDDIREDELTPDEVAELGLEDVRLDRPDDAVELADLFDDCDVESDDLDSGALDGLAGSVVEASLRGEYLPAITELVTFDGSTSDLREDERQCVAEVLFDVLGVEALVGGRSVDDVEDEFALVDLGVEFDEGDADDFDDGLDRCDLDRSYLVELSLATAGVFDFDEAACVADGLDRGEEARLVYASLLGAGDSLVDLEILDSVDLLRSECTRSDLNAYVEELAFGLINDPGRPLDEGYAFCVADTWVFSVDAEVFDSIDPGDLADISELPFLGLEQADLSALVELVNECGSPLDFLLTVLDTEPISDQQAECVAAQLTDPASAAFAIELLLATDVPAVIDDPTVEDRIEAITQAFTGCGLDLDGTG